MFGLLVFGESSDIQIVSWNVESDGAWTDVIVEQIEDFQDIDLWGLSEVQRKAEKDYINAAGIGENSKFKGFMSKKGGSDRLMIIYDSNRLELLKKIELKELTLGRKGVRPALGGLFREKESGKSFYFMVNHLYQSNKKKRHTQSRMLKKWALKNKETPIIMVGDYNYNWDIKSNGKYHDRGFDILTGVLKWIEPEKKMLTQCSAKKPSQKCGYNSILDFIFVNSEASKWKNWKSEIVKLKGEFFPAKKKSDHRPVRGSFIIDSEN
jgi:endonuclease/exonuclease/phosphatase family metal-dependent hydrolase